MSNSANQLRYNPLTGQWIIYAPARSGRPGQTDRPQAAPDRADQIDPQCPFCPGNESMLPAIIHESKSETGGRWLTRVVPNKFPALETDNGPVDEHAGPYDVKPACGRHEVIIDTPYHNRDLALLPDLQIRHVLATYLHRYRRIRQSMPQIQTILIFRNHRPASGTSLAHPHSQLIASTIIPPYIRDKEQRARQYYEQHRACLLCRMTAYEQEDTRRRLYENSGFVAFVPFAAEVPFEVWIVPKRHQADVAGMNERETAELADAFKNILSAFCDRLGDPAYNYVIHSQLRPDQSVDALHWYVQIRPRTVTPAGFEIGSGMVINPSLPEDNAALLKIETPNETR